MKKAFTLIEGLIIVVIFGLLAALLVGRCSNTQRPANDTNTPLGSIATKSNENSTYPLLPLTATNIIEHGHEWYEFSLNDNKWLYHNFRFRSESLFLIPPNNPSTESNES